VGCIVNYLYSGELKVDPELVSDVGNLAVHMELATVVQYIRRKYGLHLPATAAMAPSRGNFSLTPLLKAIPVKRLLSKDVEGNTSQETMEPGVARLRTAEGICLHVSKAVLIARSGFFRSMLTGPWMESEAEEIHVPFDSHCMMAIIHFLYTDELQEDTKEHCMSLREAASFLQCDTLSLALVAGLSACIDVDNVVEIFNYAEEKQISEDLDALFEDCKEFFIINWAIITLKFSTAKTNFHCLKSRCLEEVLCCGRVDCPTPTMREILRKWAVAQVLRKSSNTCIDKQESLNRLVPPEMKDPDENTETSVNLNDAQEQEVKKLCERFQPPRQLFNRETRDRLVRGCGSMREAFVGLM